MNQPERDELKLIKSRDSQAKCLGVMNISSRTITCNSCGKKATLEHLPLKEDLPNFKCECGVIYDGNSKVEVSYNTNPLLDYSGDVFKGIIDILEMK